jgi:hypothetical protein
MISFAQLQHLFLLQQTWDASSDSYSLSTPSSVDCYHETDETGGNAEIYERGGNGRRMKKGPGGENGKEEVGGDEGKLFAVACEDWWGLVERKVWENHAQERV